MIGRDMVSHLDTRTHGVRTQRVLRSRHGALDVRRPESRIARRSASVNLRGVLLCVLSLTFCVRAGAQTTNWPSEFPPRPLPAREIKFPPYDIQMLPNGLQVVAVLHHEQPAVTMRMLIRAGAAADPKDKLGLARLAASLLDQGTTTMSAEQMNDAIDSIGGAMGANAGTDLTFAHMVVMKDSFETGMRMLSDMVRHPGFTQAEIERQRQQTLSGLQVSLEDPEYVANSVFDRLVYGFHPYGLPDTGTPETIRSITRADLMAFHQRYFTPNNAILAIVGDVTAEEAFTMARKVFGDWERRDVTTEKFVEPPAPTRRVVVVNKPDAVQTEVRVGHIGIPRNHPDYMALNLAIRILGGEGSNRLHQVLRTERGLTYGAQANMDALKNSGDVEAETNTRSDATGEVLKLIVDEFWRLQRDRVGTVELDNAKAYLTGSFPLTIETPDSIAMQVVTVLFYGLPLEELQTFRERVNAVTVDDVQRVARNYLRPDRLSVVLVGNASEFAPQLGRVGFETFETVELGDLDLVAANLKRAQARVPAGAPAGAGAVGVGREGRSVLSGNAGRVGVAYQQAPTASRPMPTLTQEDSAKAAALVDRAINAKGGLEKLKGLKTIIATQNVTVQNPTEPTSFETTNYIQYPDRLRIETKLENGINVQAFDGASVWVKDQHGVRGQPDAVVRQVRASLRRDVVSLLLGAKSGALTPRVLPDVKDVRGRLDHVLELSAPDLNPVLLYINPQSALVDKLTFVDDAPSRPLVEESFADYREVDGIQIPFQGTRQIGTQAVARRSSDVKVNAPIDPSLFKRPTS
jgi:zinc protease